MRKFTRQRTVPIDLVWIVGDGAIATEGVGEGKLFPVVILDTTIRLDIVEYIRVHMFSGPGDVLVTWGKVLSRNDMISLTLQFQRPMEFSFSIAFELQKNHAILVEAILRSGGLYVQAGAEGDRVRTTLDKPRVIIEVPDTGFAPHWQRICLSFLTKNARAEGADRRAAKQLALTQYALLQEMAAARPFAR